MHCERLVDFKMYGLMINSLVEACQSSVLYNKEVK